jgi:hypothetical protein
MATYSSTGWHPYYFSKGFALNKWYHVVGSYKSSVVKICINADCESYSAIPPRVQAGYQIIMGATDYNYYHLRGFIDDVRIYNQAIPTSQINQNYYSGLSSLLVNNSFERAEYIERLSQLKDSLSKY